VIHNWFTNSEGQTECSPCCKQVKGEQLLRHKHLLILWRSEMSPYMHMMRTYSV